MTDHRSAGAPRHTNRLARETSPYLRQHAHNPVDWYPWGPEALAKAVSENKPIFLSVGYSACHWCHVMERESFENEEIAAYLNEHFVSVKVDREERPDLDMIYQRACQLMGQHGGWPLSAFLTPDQRPFWVGTYLPPEDRFGRPGFPRLLRGIVDAYHNRREEVERVGNQVAEALKQVEARGRARRADTEGGAEAAALRPAPGAQDDLLSGGARALARAFDHRNGGFGTAPKFPNASALELLLRHAERNRETSFREMVLFALRQMARGGIYDHLGGGFHRYSVDARWSVPHFEKMLYDNAQLPPLYLAAHQLTGDESFGAVVRETLDYVLREMTHPDGGFYSTQDADSEGEEGKYFVWTPEQFAEVLGEDADLLARHLGVTAEGNFEQHGTTVLHLAVEPAALAVEFGLPEAEVRRRIEAGKARLFEQRERRVKPGTDDKVLTGWNGLMIAAFAAAGAGLGERRYLDAARRAAEFLLRSVSSPDGGLHRSFKDGRAAIVGYLEDYACLAHGLLELYQATFKRRYLDEALRLTRQTLTRFWDDEAGFYFTPAGGERLIHRPRDVHDTSLPSATAVATTNLVRLAPFAPPAEADDWGRKATRVFELLLDEMRSNPWGNATLLLAWDLHRGGMTEITLAEATESAPAPDGGSVPDRTPDLVGEWAERLRRRHIPGRVLSLVPAELSARDAPAADAGDAPPIWAGRGARDGRATAYVCRDFACSAPLHTWEEIEGELWR